MQRKPAVSERVKAFPFLRVERDETTSHDLALARLKVLGSGLEFGFWAQPGGMTPHDAGRMRPLRTGYRHGQMLLEPAWEDHVKLWKLKKQWIPPLEFPDREAMPADPRGVVKDWESWYAWRGLSLESPAALLMDAPLSVYWLLTEVLGVVKTRKVELLGPPKKLEIHLLGVETELNYLPLCVRQGILGASTTISFNAYTTRFAGLANWLFFALIPLLP